ncbi:MAG: nucleotidyl transferase AbiEii/AbiGii toxin family protein [Candidatus Omnitrophota bacterium]
MEDVNIKIIDEYLDKTLEVLSGAIDDFYLAGGTALSKFYFDHRGSFDLDFFTKKFSEKRVEEITTYIGKKLNLQVKLAGVTDQKGKIQVRTYYLIIDTENKLKLDFVEDRCPVLKGLNRRDGIYFLSKEDLYLRKIFAMCGSRKDVDDIGRDAFFGGRQESKDYFDVYCLSSIFIPLSDFVLQFCGDSQMVERLILWQRTYDRFAMKSGLIDLITKTVPDARLIEKHFDKEIEKLIKAVS